METKGEEFIKKVQLQQEKNEIEKRLNEIESEQAIQNEEVVLSPNLEREIKKQEEQEYSDIMLNTNSSNENDKKKFILYGFILLFIFLITVLLIRLLSDDSSSDNSFSKNEQSSEKELLENENIEDQYQKIIEEKLKSIKEENEKNINEDEKLNLQEIEEKETLVKESKPSKPNVFDIKNKDSNKKVVQKNTPKKVEKKVKKIENKVKTTKKSVTKKAKNTITNKPKGTFVQIGAFSKMPNNKYLSSITKKGFNYKIYKVSINNKTFHKVLIGPYNSKGQAKLAIANIKKKLNISGAFVLKF